MLLNVSAPLLLEIFDEDIEVRNLVEQLGFKYITSKIAASSDIKGIYASGVTIDYKLQSGEDVNIKELSNQFLTDAELEQIKTELQTFTSWADHYSSYNKRQSWSAFALRGYKAEDPNFIIKPNEMSQKWKLENVNMLTETSAWTTAVDKFPITQKIVQSKFAGSVPDRVRFMRLTKGKGELSRHADITDREAGVQEGRVVRLHIPIYTNPNVIFNSWTHKGERTEANMSEGSLWYLDVRKPHTAVNHGEEDRVHLVMDFFASRELSNFIKQ